MNNNQSPISKIVSALVAASMLVFSTPSSALSIPDTGLPELNFAFQADLTVGKNATDHIGDNVYSAAEQTLKSKLDRKGKGHCYINLQSDGNTVDTITLTGNAKSRDLKASYYTNDGSRSNVTAALKAGGYTAEQLPAGQVIPFKAEIKATRKAMKKNKVRGSFRLIATSTGRPTQTGDESMDAVEAKFSGKGSR